MRYPLAWRSKASPYTGELCDKNQIALGAPGLQMPGQGNAAHLRQGPLPKRPHQSRPRWPLTRPGPYARWKRGGTPLLRAGLSKAGREQIQGPWIPVYGQNAHRPPPLLGFLGVSYHPPPPSGRRLRRDGRRRGGSGVQFVVIQGLAPGVIEGGGEVICIPGERGWRGPRGPPPPCGGPGKK